MNIFWIIFFLCPSKGSDVPVVAVGEASLAKETIVFESPHPKNSLHASRHKEEQELFQLFVNNFRYYQKRFSVETTPFTNKTVSYDMWEKKKTDYLIRFDFSLGKSLFYRVVGYDIGKKKEFFSSKGLIEKKNLRSHGHEISNMIYKKITGKDSIFNSKITFVSDRTGFKELYITDFDGGRMHKLTNHRGLVISPSISNDGKRIVYSLIKGKRGRQNIDLYIYYMDKKKSEKVSSFKGINSGAIFTPDGNNVLLTLSFTGNAEIFKLHLNTKRLQRITRHYALDVDPSLSMDGTKMAFLSSRPGKAMVYIMDPREMEKDVKRIGFVGKFNATPRFNPDGSEIAFASWSGKGFDIYRMSANGTGLVRLTRDFGSNEDPSYSSDGEFIVFSSRKRLSRKKTIHNLHIIDRDGGLIGSLTRGFGNCITPRWSRGVVRNDFR